MINIEKKMHLEQGNLKDTTIQISLQIWSPGCHLIVKFKVSPFATNIGKKRKPPDFETLGGNFLIQQVQ